MVVPCMSDRLAPPTRSQGMQLPDARASGACLHVNILSHCMRCLEKHVNCLACEQSRAHEHLLAIQHAWLVSACNTVQYRMHARSHGLSHAKPVCDAMQILM